MHLRHCCPVILYLGLFAVSTLTTPDYKNSFMMIKIFIQQEEEHQSYFNVVWMQLTEKIMILQLST